MEASLRAIKDTYERWGLGEAIAEHKTTAPAEFRGWLARIESRIPSIPCRVMPSSFDPHDPELCGVPAPLAPAWPSLERALRAFRVEGAIVRLPLFWQIEAPLHAACRAAGAYLFMNEPENMPLGAAALRLAEADLVATTPEDASAFATYLAEKSLTPARAWLLAQPIDRIQEIPSALAAESIQVAQEAHLFPGITALEQCDALWARKEPVFHVSQEFKHAFSGGRLLLTSADAEHPLPLYRYEAPGRFSETSCSCGKPAFAPRT